MLAELDYLLAKHVELKAQSALLLEVLRGAYRLEAFTPTDISEANTVTSRHPDLQIGLADASIVVLALEYGANEVLTLDERHFRVLRIGERKRFRILPVDL